LTYYQKALRVRSSHKLSARQQGKYLSSR